MELFELRRVVVTVILLIIIYIILYYLLQYRFLFDTKKEAHVIFRDEKTKNKNLLIFHKDTDLVNGTVCIAGFPTVTIPC